MATLPATTASVPASPATVPCSAHWRRWLPIAAVPAAYERGCTSQPIVTD
jgi:hypothetical protein